MSHTHQRYIVRKIDKKQIVPFYFLKNERGEELTGKFHGNQLVKINLKRYRSFPVEIKKTKRGEKHLMRFEGYSKDYDQWMSPGQFVDID